LNQDQQPKARNILPDCIIPAVALAFTIYYLTTITEVPWTSQASAVFVSCLLLLAILAYVVRSVWRMRRGQEVLRLRGSFEQLLGPMPTSARRIALLVLVVAYVAVIDELGFTLATFCFVFASILLLSSRAHWKKALAVALCCALTGYIVFVYFFHTRFPTGPIENWLKGLL